MKAGARFDQTTTRCRDFLACDGNFGILNLGKRDPFFDVISGGRRPQWSRQSQQDQQRYDPNPETHFVYLSAKAFFFNKNPSRLYGYISSCKRSRVWKNGGPICALPLPRCCG